MRAAVADLWSQIPRGRAATYGDLAEALGDRVAARWVGHAALHHDHGSGCACHRLVQADGKIGQYVGGPSAKAHLLRSEGIRVHGGRVDLKAHRCATFRSERPLAQLRAIQTVVAARLRVERPDRRPTSVGGIDTSYADEEMGVAAYTLFARGGGRPVWSTTVGCPIRFPYIASFLSFRELPLLLALLEHVREARRLPDVLLVDGSGILHPRRAGLASHLGVAADLPTIGVTKSHLIGTVVRWPKGSRSSSPVTVDGDVVGAAMRGGGTSRKPIYVSPGHGVDVATAVETVAASLVGHRLPEPLHWADRISRDAARG